MVPGQYTVKLTVNGRSYSRPLTVKMDPRVKTPAAGLAQQFALSTQLADAIHRDFVALTAVRALRAQLKTLKDRAPEGAVADAVAALDAKAAAIEGAGGGGLGGGGGGRGGAGDQSLTRLNGELAGLMGTTDGADATPTTQATTGAAELERALSGLLGRWNDLRTRDVATLNTQLRQANLQPITMP